jgi:hypothetical protein
MSCLSVLKSALEAKRGFSLNMLIGVDGFVDEIIHVVDKRMDYENYSRINTIGEFAERIGRASGLSANIEFVPVQTKLGGNGPILSNAILEYGVNLTYIGALGSPAIHPVFKSLVEKSAAVYSLCEPAFTDALEFLDGKLMLGRHTALAQITWERVKEAMGGARAIAAMIGSCHLFGMENWTMVPRMSSVWEGLITEVFPLLEAGEQKPLAFFDLADPEKRTREDIAHAMGLITRFEEKFRTVLGLNEKELYQIAAVFGIEAGGLRETVMETYRALGIHCLMVHPVKEAMCCVGGECYRVDGPFCQNPVLTTGAGDNFNAGFCLGLALDLDPEHALALGAATSGFYVRNAKSPTLDEVLDFIERWDSGLLS